MSRHYTSDEERQFRRTASAPYRLPSRSTAQHAAAPRQPTSTVPQSPAALQQYMISTSPYPSTSGQYTTTRPTGTSQQASASTSKTPAPPSAITVYAKNRAYSRRRILLVWFQSHDFDPPDLNKELAGVANLFSNCLGFERPQTCAITDSNTSPTEQLITTLTAFTGACGDKNELLVVYYSGHGGARNQGGLNLQARRKTKADEKVYWNRIQKEVLFTVDADVLVLLDCCHAEWGVKGLHRYRRDSIAACAADKTTAIPGERSFTACLLQAAKQLLPHGRFTVQHLFERIKVVAAQIWNDGAARAEKPIYKDQCGDETEHEIWFEYTTPANNAPPSASVGRATQPAVGNRRRTSTRRGPSDASDESSSESEEESEGDEEESASPSGSRPQPGATEAAWQAHRTNAQSAWKRMTDQGQTPAQAFEQLVTTWQARMHLSRQDAEAQIRRLLAR
ncbi:hypothetical protein PRZ48_000088 [Zasmidium cellare]|uniref:Uncharacterized protein n=1 Tax=Zasmidium cellare TaxID=395010 RepID=A0ABR0EYS4_ZASCE|nr:hypothetical protein PRZ48_000088 [Zasmidium cellare]